MDDGDLPFKVGQDVEARSFLSGYRGAWFRCKIKEIGWRNNAMGHALEYYDFPDEKIRWTRLYQQYNRYKKQRHLMVRPKYPPVYRESELPDAESISEAVVVINDVWKVGDMVDWWADGCYWSGRLAEKLGEEKFRVDLLSPPDGEGLSYEASIKDLRPSLHWSAALGWKVPIPKDGGNCNLRARVILPAKLGRKHNQVITGALQEHKGSHSSKAVTNSTEALEEHKGSHSSKALTNSTEALEEHKGSRSSKALTNSIGALQEHKGSNSSKALTNSLLCPGRLEQSFKEPSRIIASKEIELFKNGTNLQVMHNDINKSSCLNRDSSLQVGDQLMDRERNGNEKVDFHGAGLSKKRTLGSISLSSRSVDRNLDSHGIDASVVTVANADMKSSNCYDGQSKKKSDGNVSLCSDRNSGLHVRDASVKIARETNGGKVIGRNPERKDNQHDNGPSQKIRNGGISLNSMRSDTIEAAILDLEELVNRVKWLKNILEFGTHLPNSECTSWKFVQHRGPSITK